MLWTDVQKDWKILSKKFKTNWSKLSDADLTAISGKREELVKRLSQHYKTDKVKIEREIDDFVKSLKAAKA